MRVLSLSLSFFLFPSSLSKGSASTEPALLSLLPCGSSGSKMKHVKTKARKMTRAWIFDYPCKAREGGNTASAWQPKSNPCNTTKKKTVTVIRIVLIISLILTTYIRLHITIATIFIIEYNCIFNIRKADLSSAPHAPDGPVRAWRLTTGRLGTAAYVIGQIASMMSI